MLTGQIKSPDDFEQGDLRRMLPRFSKKSSISWNIKKNCTIGQLTLAWILAQGEQFFVIPGTTKIKNLEE